MMYKRGGLFYIIDAFIASAIITMTIVTILSLTPTHSDDSLQNSFERYISFMSSPSSVSGTSIFDKAALLIAMNQSSDAEDFVASLTVFALDPQFGVEVFFVTNSSRTAIFSRGNDENVDSRLTSNVLVSAYSPASFSESLLEINIGDPSSVPGQDACDQYLPGSRCAYVSVDCSGTEYIIANRCYDSVEPCSGAKSFPVCVSFTNETIVGPDFIEVSMWVD